MSGFFMLRRDFIEEIAPNLSVRGFKILLDILVNAGTECRVIELPYRFRSRQRGTSKLDAQVAVDFVELVAARASYGILPDRFLSFTLVGATGIGVHFVALSVAHSLLLVPFAWLQTFAAMVAMASNFVLNNTLTYYDQRLSGYKALLGFCLFASICSVGLLSNISISTWLYDEHGSWQIAGLFGAAVSAFWNYAVSRKLVWRS
jgi:dolichol-phosphate mannosyltransferase